MTDPLVVEFLVGAAPHHAFAVWTERIDMWWPHDHTISGEPADIVVEGRTGGRVFERAQDGTEHDWAAVVAWDPPHRVAYRWHMFFDPAEATDLEVTFAPEAGGTRVRLTQTGWDSLGDGGPQRRERTGTVWRSMAARYAAAAGAPG